MEVDQTGFQDYTISSTFEKFVAAVENVLASICKGSSPETAKTYAVAHGLPFRKEPYLLTYLPVCADVDRTGKVLQNHRIKFHEWFLVEDCILVEPDSYSRRILNLEEYHTILSGVSVALDNLLDHKGDGCGCPVYIPMLDALRDAYGGIRKMRGSSGQIVVQHFQCDSVHGRVDMLSQYVSDFQHRLKFFSERLQCYDSVSADVCAELADSPLQSPACMCWTKTTYHMYHLGTSDAVEYAEPEGWDEGLPWTPWVTQDDPVGGVEVDIVYDDWKNVDRVEHEHQSFSDAIRDGSSWRMFAMDADHAPDTGDRSFLTLRVTDTSRKFLSSVDIEHYSDDEILQVQTRMSGEHSFCAKLHRYMQWYQMVKETTQTVQNLTEDAWWMDHVDVFDHEIDEDDIEKLILDIFTQGESETQGRHGVGISLFERLSLNATIPDSLRGLAQLWMLFIKYIREEHIEKKREIPFMESAFLRQTLRCCSVVRAIGSLNYCIKLMTKENEDTVPCLQEEMLKITLLDHPEVNIKVPITQTIPPDILETGLGHGEPRVNLYKSMLVSDMQAFKAANDGCRFEDFIRWYSPRDWIESDNGGSLSQRMEGDSAWTHAWKTAEPIPVASQNTLFDPSEESIKILEQLESIEPFDLVSQMSISLFSAACHILKNSESLHVQRQINRLEATAGRHAEWFSSFDLRYISEKDSTWFSNEVALENGFGLFNALSCIEHSAAAVASLHQRLDGIDATLRTKMVEGMLESAMRGYDLDIHEAESLAACDQDENNTVSFDGPVAIEHSIDAQASLDSEHTHRLFVNRLPREIRISTSITSA